MHSPFQPLAKIRPISRSTQTESVPAKTQTLKEWSMAGGGVPTQYKGREHVWHAMVDKFAAGGAAQPAALIDGNDFVKAAQANGLKTDNATLNKIVARVNKGEGVDQAAKNVAQSRAAGGEAHMGPGGLIKGLAGKAADAAKAARKVEAPAIIIPSKVSNVKEAVRQSKGDYGARRVERAADEIPNLERLYKEEALKRAFEGDNAKALMTMNPADFEKFSHPLTFRKKPWPGSGPKKENLPTNEYVKYLSELDEFHDIPFLEINKQEQGLPLMPFIAGHEGRHRNRALTERGESAGLVQLFPRSELREPFPRRSQDEYLQALREELEMTGNLVLPEKYTVPSDSVFDKQIQRPAIKLPDVYAKGGEVHMAGAGDPAFYPRVGNIKSKNFKPVKPPPLIEDPRAMNLPQFGDVDLSVPTQANLDLGKRMAQREADLKRQQQGDRSLPEKIAGVAQAGRFMGSALTQAVNSVPTRIAYGDEAADKFMQDRLYKPEQPTAYEYAGDVGDFLEKLETEYKIPPVLPEATALQSVVGPATSQAKKAVGSGALSLAQSDAAYKLAQKALASPALAAVRPMNVVKPTGGNFLTGRTEKDLQPLKRNVTTRAIENGRYTPEQVAQLAESPRVQANDALNNWVDSNLTNYVKKQMGTADDPVRLMFDKRAQEIDAQYAKDIEKSERIAQRATGESDPRKQANLMREAERIKAEANLERQTAVNHISHKPALLDEYLHEPLSGQQMRANEYVGKKRTEAGFPEEGLGQSTMAKAWERASDEIIASHRAGDIQKAQNPDKNPFNESWTEHYLDIAAENPYVAKLDPNTTLYSAMTGDLGFDHIMDVLREDLTTGRIRPDQMNKISITDAIRRTSEYDRDLADKMNASRAAAREGLPTYREYPEGYKWIQLNKPGSFAQESEAMGHSVRGYEPPKGHPDWTEASGDAGSSNYGQGGWEAIKSGKAKVYSLVDSKGAPHATVEVRENKDLNPFFEWWNQQTPEKRAEINQRAQQGEHNNSVFEAPEWLAARPALLPRITQIRGKQNRAPNEEYLPYIQDFVKGGQWSEVGDFRNTGLRDLQRTPKLDEYLKQKGVEVPRYMDEGEYQKYESDFLMDQLYPKNDPQYLPPQTPEGMAGGGAVRMQKGGKSGALVSVAEAVAAASKKADEILDAKKAAGKLEEVMKAKQAPMVAPQGTGLPLMPRSQGMYIPGVKQENLPRMPKVDKARAEGKQPAYTERMQDLLDSPTARKKVDKLINKGKDLDVLEWYGIEPLRQVAMNAGRTPEQFESLVAQLASASQRNPVDQQNKMGSYLHYLSQTGQLPDDAFLLTNKIKRGKQEMPAGTPIELPPGYGSLAQGDIFGRGKQIASGDIMGALPPDKKLGTFYRNYLGNLKPVTVDVNAVRGPIIERGDPRWLASKLVEKDEEGNVIATHFPRRDVAEGRMSLKEAKDRPGFWEAAPSGSEYAGFEDLWQRGAKRHDIEPAEAQALGWYGSADVTALKTKPELYVDNLERMIKRTAEQTGRHPLQVLEDIVSGKGFLYKEGGLVEKRFDGGGMAAADFVGPEDSGGSLDKAKLMAKILAEEAKKQGSKEAGSLSKPRALTDLLNRGVLANNPLSAGVDLFNMGLSAVGMGSDKPFLGSEHVKDLMNKYNVTSGEERPMMETALSFASPTAMIKGAMKAPGAVTKVTEALTSSKIPPLATEAKTAQAGKPTGVAYATKQEGPFYRVTPTNLDTSAAKTRGIKEANGLQSSAPLGGGTEQSGREVPKFLSSEEVGRIIADPVANEPLNIAKKYTQDTQGADFGVPQVPSSSLAKQSGIARTFDLAVQGSPEYKSAIFGAYGREMPELMEKIGAKNYDDLMEKAYRQMAKETDEQFRRLPYNFSYHRAGEGNYNGAKDMASDVHGNKHLYVYQGGDKHDFLHNVDPQSGLNENEKFRAVHDLLGHAIYGNEFGPKGEEMAWAVHQQMYSPLARMAMTAETRGQNSVVNYSPLNAKLKETIAEYERLGNEALRRGDTKFAKEIAELKKQAYFGFEFAPNKAVLLPPEFMNPRFTGGVPDYLAAANQPTPGTSIQSPLTHFSNKPDLTFTDPRKYGTGIKGAEADRLTNYPGAVRDRSYFYMGEPGTVSPEPGLGVNRYRGESSSLYDITQDPLNFSVLAREANRTPYTSRANQGVTYPLQEANDIERLVREYGYQGMANPKATKPTAIMFGQTPVQRQKRGGLSSIK